VADERDTEAYRHRRDPPVAVMDLVAKGVTRLLAPVAELSAGPGQIVVALDDRQLGDVAIEPAPAQLTQLARNAPNRSSITVWNERRTGR
jgi:hypothetical protein